MDLRLVMSVLCAIGLYASVFMLAKTGRADRGELAEPSVVQTPRASLFGNLPNALFGAVYYAALVAAIWTVHSQGGLAVIFAIALAAAGTSAFLAYSLLFITRMPCMFCWTSHVVNWLLAAGTIVLAIRA
ncbi:MAG: vitamin K epoxide reductase family protein [Candidatus Eremiobacteraeota bacterium]|nr:vitamin K epoxide reductase family protein [Candidatus Eremiobacteraeota bacterium]